MLTEQYQKMQRPSNYINKRFGAYIRKLTIDHFYIHAELTRVVVLPG